MTEISVTTRPIVDPDGPFADLLADYRAKQKVACDALAVMERAICGAKGHALTTARKGRDSDGWTARCTCGAEEHPVSIVVDSPA